MPLRLFVLLCPPFSGNHYYHPDIKSIDIKKKQNNGNFSLSGDN
jgi:hypothetical protein